MKWLIIYDSAYGNTAQIAQAIGDGLRDAASAPDDVKVVHVGAVTPEHLAELAVLIVGSPTQGFRPTGPIKDFLKQLPKGSLNAVRVAAFDTRFTEKEIHSHGFVLSKLADTFGYAAKPIAESLQQKGGHLVVPPEGFFVSGKEGPLLAGEAERAAEWGRGVV